MENFDRLTTLPGTAQEQAWLKERLETLSVREGYALTAALTQSPPESMGGAIDLCCSLDDFEICNAGSYEQLGKLCLMGYRLPKEILPHVDLCRLGEKYKEGHPGLFVGDNFVVLSFETMKKEDGTPFSQYYISKAVNSVRNVIDYLMSDMRDNDLNTPKPYMNPFAIITFHNLRQYNTPTTIIPESVAKQLDRYAIELPPLHKLLYDIFMNTGLRLKEVFFLEEDCIEPSQYTGICQLKFKPHKVLAARHRRGVGDYHRVMIPQELADKLSRYIADTKHIRQTTNSPYIFLSQRLGYDTTVMDAQPFIRSVRGIIKKHNICGDDGELWHFTSRQFRKTIAVHLIENGATTAELAYWLGHLCTDTAAKYYAEVRKMKLAELNTRFFMEKFDLIVSSEGLEKYTEEERKLLYADFRLGQRRVEFGFCMLKAADGPCLNRNSLYNCVNCKNLCTGKQYLPYWKEMLEQQEAIFKRLLTAYQVDGISNYTKYAEYKQELSLLNGYKNIVEAIQKGGRMHE